MDNENKVSLKKVQDTASAEETQNGGVTGRETPENVDGQISAAAQQDAGTDPTGETDTPDQATKKKAKKSVGKEILDWVLSIVAAVLIVMLIRTFLFNIIKVDGHSMDTTLADGERLYVSVLTMKINGPQRGDVVICHYPDRTSKFLGIIEYQTYFVKRIVGMPGDVIYRENGFTYVSYTDENGEEQTIRLDKTRRYGSDFEPITLGEDEYYVCGDNRDNSNDSRNIGPITGDMICGKVRYVIWPLGEIRSVGSYQEIYVDTEN